MTALQVSIGALNDVARRPRRCRPQARQADPGRPRERAASRGPSSLGGAVLGVALGGLLDVRVGGARGRRACSSATATTSWPRGRPGRGCRSPSASRSCRSTAGWARPGDLPVVLHRPRPDGGRWPARRSPSRTPGRTSSGIVAAGTVSVATRLGLEGSWRLHAALWASDRSSWDSGWLAFRGVGLVRDRPGASPPLASSGRRSVWSRDRPDRPVASGPGSSRRSGPRWPCWPGWLRSIR